MTAYLVFDTQAKMYLGRDGKMVKGAEEALRLALWKAHKIRADFIASGPSTPNARAYREGVLIVETAPALVVKPNSPGVRVLHVEELAVRGMTYPLCITYEEEKTQDGTLMPSIGLSLGEMPTTFRVSCNAMTPLDEAPEVKSKGTMKVLEVANRVVEWGRFPWDEGDFVLRMFNEGRKGPAFFHLDLEGFEPVKLPDAAGVHIRTTEPPWISATGPFFSLEGARASRDALGLKNPTATMYRVEPISGVLIEEPIT